jgi:short-subunit dehydrogenase
MNIIITGASRGIGQQIAKIMANDDNNRILAISRNKPKLKQLQVECLDLNSNSKLIPITFDLVEENFSPLLDEIKKYVDHVDILINNAGQLVMKPFESYTSEDISRMMNVNFYSPAKLIKSVLPLLRRAKSAHVVNISSMAGFQGSSKYPGLSFYSASKAAIATLTECLAEEYKESSIRFNALCLGAVQTEMFEEAFPGYEAPVSSKEMGDFIVDFALSASKVMNGKVLPVSLSNP